MGRDSTWYRVPLALSVGDIVSDYLLAKNQKKMVQILADQCATKPARIKWVLWKSGVAVRLTGAGPAIEAYGDRWESMDGAACAAVREKMIEWNGVEQVEENMDSAEKSAVEPVCWVHTKTIVEDAHSPHEREVVAETAASTKRQASTADVIVSMIWDYYLDRCGLTGITAEMVERMRRLMALGDKAAKIMEGDL